MAKETATKEEILKSISGLLDETIEEYDKLEKADTSHSNLKLQPDENGDMPGKANQAGKDVMKPLKKKEEAEGVEKKDHDYDEEDEKEMDKNKYEEECDPKEMDMDKDDEDDDDEDDKDENPFAKKKKKKMKKSAEEDFDRKLIKSLQRLGLIEEEADEKVAKSEGAEAEEEKIEKSEDKTADKLDEIKKAQDVSNDKLTEVISKIGERIEKLEKRPAEGRRSVDGLSAIRKSNDDTGTQEEILDKGKVVEQLLEKQRGGDTRVRPELVAKAEMARTPQELKEIVKDIIN